MCSVVKRHVLACASAIVLLNSSDICAGSENIIVKIECTLFTVTLKCHTFNTKMSYSELINQEKHLEKCAIRCSHGGQYEYYILLGFGIW
jgi:hypothetical protein